MGKVGEVIKRGDLMVAIRYLIAKWIVSRKHRVIWNMIFAEGESIGDYGGDYVRYASLELMSREIQRKGILGDVAELGVYRGDFAKHLNRVFADRKLYLFDTFEGFAETDVSAEVEAGYSSGEQDFSNTNEEIVMSKMISPENVIIRKGWFPDTTEGLEEKRFIFVSIDADLYEPIYEGMKFFYPRLVEGGGNICA